MSGSINYRVVLRDPPFSSRDDELSGALISLKLTFKFRSQSVCNFFSVAISRFEPQPTPDIPRRTATMAVKATWSKICEGELIQRSSQTLTVVDGAAYIFGGELRPREPVDSSVYRIDASQRT